MGACAGVEVDVEDGGAGFVVPDPPERLARSGKLGLLGIRERAQLVGGAVSIHSGLGRGTRLTVSVAERPSEPDAEAPNVPA